MPCFLLASYIMLKDDACALEGFMCSTHTNKTNATDMP